MRHGFEDLDLVLASLAAWDAGDEWLDALIGTCPGDDRHEQRPAGRDRGPDGRRRR
jgi:hypothetical protein